MTQNRCIFCKSCDRRFTSREHIIPESLGNTEHTLPPGVVCDACNNYFASKVEQPILETLFFTQLRNRFGIPNKRLRIPPIDALSFPDAIRLQLATSTDGEQSIYGVDDYNSGAFVSALQERATISVLVPVAEFPDGRMFARFLAKMALEAWAKRLLDVGGDLEVDLTHKREFDEIRVFARFDVGIENWPYSKRLLYSEGHQFTDDGVSYVVLHEYTFHYTDQNELYFVIAFHGVEFAINLGGPEMQGYDLWLNRNSMRSPLYPNGF